MKLKLTRKFRHTWALRSHVWLALTLGIISYIVMPQKIAGITRMIMSWDIFVLGYLVATVLAMARSSAAKIKKRARIHNEGATTMLMFISLASIASIAGVIVDIANRQPDQGYWPILLAGGTIALSWFFVHTIFALRYAHDYYSTDTPMSLVFPAGEDPNYIDFIYFSYTIGYSCSTSDVEIHSREARAITTVHGGIAFIFNATILSMALNIGSSMIGK